MVWCNTFCISDLFNSTKRFDGAQARDLLGRFRTAEEFLAFHEQLDKDGKRRWKQSFAKRAEHASIVEQYELALRQRAAPRSDSGVPNQEAESDAGQEAAADLEDHAGAEMEAQPTLEVGAAVAATPGTPGSAAVQGEAGMPTFRLTIVPLETTNESPEEGEPDEDNSSDPHEEEGLSKKRSESQDENAASTRVKRAKVVQSSTIQTRSALATHGVCPNGHRLQHSNPFNRTHSWFCNGCRMVFPETVKSYNCRPCNYDRCSACMLVTKQ